MKGAPLAESEAISAAKLIKIVMDCNLLLSKMGICVHRGINKQTPGKKRRLSLIDDCQLINIKGGSWKKNHNLATTW